MNCPRCGQTVEKGAFICGSCGAEIGATPTVPPMAPASAGPQRVVQPQSSDIGQDAGIRMLIPVGRSGLAIAAGYAGLFSLTCIIGPIAILLGILAILDIKKHSKKHGMGRAIFGVVMGTLGTIGLVIGIISGLMG